MSGPNLSGLPLTAAQLDAAVVLARMVDEGVLMLDYAAPMAEFNRVDALVEQFKGGALAKVEG